MNNKTVMEEFFPPFAEENNMSKKVESFPPKTKPNSKPQKLMNRNNEKEVVRTYVSEVTDSKTGQKRKETVIDGFETADFNWEKLWIANLLIAMESLGSKRVDTAMWLLKNKTSDNHIIYTQREISEMAGVSLKTVNDTIKLLLSCDALRRRTAKGVLMWNPDIIAYGKNTRRKRLSLEFSKAMPAAND